MLGGLLDRCRNLLFVETSLNKFSLESFKLAEIIMDSQTTLPHFVLRNWFKMATDSLLVPIEV